MEALEIFNEKPTDIIISDIQMPEVDGLNLLQKIKTISPQTIRVVMTAFNSPEYLNRAVQAQTNLYLKKPIDIDEFLVAISSYISLINKNEDISPLGNDYFYNYLKKVVTKDEKTIKLTKKEVLFLELLLKNKQAITSIEQIENDIWQEPTTPDAIRMVVVGIRKKLYHNIIENIKGLGYKLNFE